MDCKSKSDSELIELIIECHKPAFDELYIRYSRKLVNFLYRMLNKDYEKAQDFLHDVFLKIIENPKSYKPEKSSFSTWIYTIAYNKCKNEYKKESIRRNYNENELMNSKNSFTEIKGNIDNHLFGECLEKELRQLDEKHRAIFVLRYNDELPIKEIAEIMDIPEGTVKSRLFYVTQKLASRLKEFNPHSG